MSGYGITDNVAYRETWNNFIHTGNEFTFASPAYSGLLWMNYRTASGNTDGAITEYRFAKGAGFSYADIRAAKYIVNGGTSSQFLKADGSLDSTAYLPLSGGTITRSDRKQLLLKNSNASGLSALWIGGEFETFTHGAQFLYDGELSSIAIANFASYTNNRKGLGALRITKDNKIQVGDVYFSGGYVYDIIHSGNYSSYALPLSGGTITGALKINTHTDRSLILDEPTGEKYHHISFAAGGVEYATITSTNLGTVNELLFNGETIIHSGNIGSYNAGSADVIAKTYANESINYAPDESKIRLISGYASNSVDLGFPKRYVGGISVITNYVGWQMVTYGNIGTPNPYFRSVDDKGVWSAWKQLAFLTDNVASAQALTHSNGTIGVSVTSTGALQDKDGYQFFVCGSLSGQTFTRYQAFGSPSSAVAAVLEGGGAVSLKTNNIDRLFINSSGKVLIGTTTDNGSTGNKVRIQNTVGNRLSQLALGNLINRSDFAIEFYDGDYYGLYTCVDAVSGNVGMQVGRSDGNTSVYSLCLNPLGGNVGIGTTNPAYKLDVAGTGRFNDKLTVNRSIEVVSGTDTKFVFNNTDGERYNIIDFQENGTSLHQWVVSGNTFSIIGALNVSNAVVMSSTLSVSKLTKLSNTTRYALEITTSTNSHIVSFNGVNGDESAQLGYDSSIGLYGFNYNAYKNDIRTHVTGFGISNDGIFYISPTGTPDTSNAYFKVASGGDVTIANNLIIAGDMSSTSDMRLKHHIEDVILDLNTIAEMPIFTFRWKDGRDGRLHLGSSAQYWEKPAPWLVMGDSSKTLNYAVLGVAGIKSIAVTTVDHETRIKMLERKVNELETENRRLRYGN